MHQDSTEPQRPPSFESVYREHFDFVWRTLRQLGVRQDDAIDAAQDVFIIVYRRLHEFEGRAKLTSWLFEICWRVARNKRTSAAVRREVFTDWLAWLGIPDTAPNAAEVLRYRADFQTLEQLIGRLPQELRDVFVMFELQDMGGEEIAELTGIPVGTVRSRLRRAREAFSGLIAQARARKDFDDTYSRVSDSVHGPLIQPARVAA